MYALRYSLNTMGVVLQLGGAVALIMGVKLIYDRLEKNPRKRKR